MHFNIFLAIAVNFIWGLAFLIPYYFIDVSPIIIVSGRYITYGLISFFFLSLSKKERECLNKNDWRMAMVFAFAGNIGYYLAVTFAIHYIGIATTALIVGTLPVTMAIYANWTHREFSYRKLMAPIFLILTGLIGVNYLQYSHTDSHQLHEFIEGISFALLALAAWTWFGVHNARYLKKNLHISSHAWSNAIGVSCLVQAMIFLPLSFVQNASAFTFGHHTIWQIILASLILGILVSWLATIFWNKVSRQIPTALAAQLIVFETISSLLYGSILDRNIPPPLMFLSITLILAGVVMSIRMAFKKTALVAPS